MSSENDVQIRLNGREGQSDSDRQKMQNKQKQKQKQKAKKMNYESDVKKGSEVDESSREHSNQTQNQGNKLQCKVVKSESENSDVKSLSHAKSYARVAMGK